MAIPTGILFYDPRAKPLSVTGQFQSGCYLCFFSTGTTNPVNVYADGLLATPLSQPAPGSTNPSAGTVASSDGRFVPIYLNPAVVYRCQMFSAAGLLLEDTDPLSVQTVYPGLTENANGDFTIAQPSAGTALTINSAAGNAALALNQPTVTNSLFEVFQLQGTTYGIVGVAGANDALITGSLTGDVLLRTQGTNFLISVNSGTNAAVKINTAGSVVIGTPTTGQALIVNGITYDAHFGGLSYVMNNNGSDYGYLANPAANVWALGHGTSNTALGSSVLTWNATGNVAIVAPVTGPGLVVGAPTGSGIGTILNGGLQIEQALSGDSLQVRPSITTGALMGATSPLTNGGGGNVGTLNTAPAAGNPTKWIKINDNGTIRAIPAW